MYRICKRVKSKKGISLIELVVTIALLSIFATVSTAIVWIVMQTFQSSTDMSLNSQEISQTQKMLHSSAEVAQNIEKIEDITGLGVNSVTNPKKEDRVLLCKQVSGEYKLCLYICTAEPVSPGSNATWEELAPFDGIKTAKFELTRRTLIPGSTAGDNHYRFSYTFTTEKDFAYSGGAEINNMNAGIPFNDKTTPPSAVEYDMSVGSNVIICFRA